MTSQIETKVRAKQEIHKFQSIFAGEAWGSHPY